MAPNDIVNAICAGAKDGLVPALVIGLARGIQWILTASGIIDPIIYSISETLKESARAGGCDCGHVRDCDF